MKQVVILHAWQSTPSDHWYPWLKEVLERREYSVHIPTLVDNETPTLEQWRQCVLSGEEMMRSPVVIGHSLGAVLALRLAEEKRIEQLILVAGWDFWDLTPEHETFFQQPIDHAKVQSNTGSILVIHSDNDPYITPFQAEECAKRLKADFILLRGKGHFTKSERVVKMPVILKEIAR